MRLRRTTTPFLTSGKLLRYAKNSPTCFTERGLSCAALRRGGFAPTARHGRWDGLDLGALRLLDHPLAAPPWSLAVASRLFRFAQNSFGTVDRLGRSGTASDTSPKKKQLHPLEKLILFSVNVL
jgi:hypothetical protein